jgi:CheY-like chemotaxis protein
VAPHKILVIDDSRVIRNMVRDMLPPATFEIVEAADGVKGLEAAQTEKPWLIMLDFLLPKMSGFDVYENLQKDGELSRIPLVLMSGRKEEVTSRIPEPFDDKYLAFIAKPFEQRDLVNAIKRAKMLVEKKPFLSVISNTGIPTAEEAAESAAESAASAELLKRVSALEEKTKHIHTLEEKVKLLEQQVVTQHKQLQQLVEFIKKKMA